MPATKTKKISRSHRCQALGTNSPLWRSRTVSHRGTCWKRHWPTTYIMWCLRSVWSGPM